MRPIETSMRILEGTHTLLVNEGVRALTLYNAARWSGLSKGAVLYHFPNKEILVRSLLEHALDQCLATQPQPGSPIPCQAASEALERLGWALLAARSHSPAALSVMEGQLRALFEGLLEFEGDNLQRIAVTTWVINSLFRALGIPPRSLPQELV